MGQGGNEGRDPDHGGADLPESVGIRAEGERYQRDDDREEPDAGEDVPDAAQPDQQIAAQDRQQDTQCTSHCHLPAG